MGHTYSVRRIGRETVRYSDGELSLDMDCYRDPSNGSYMVVIGDNGISAGHPLHLTVDELRVVEDRVRTQLEIKRVFGFAVGRRAVNIVRSQSVV